ncbi:glycosyltransferase [Evansella tamaricis]
MFKKLVAGILDWFMYKVLSTKQKQLISNLFTQEQKNFMKKTIKPGKKRAQVRKIERLKFRMYNLGFINRGLSDLQYLLENSEDSYLRKLAAWELATYYANQYTEENAKQCLYFLNVATKGEKDIDLLRRSAILMTECYEILGNIEEGKQVLTKLINKKPHVDLYLARANMEPLSEDRIPFINEALKLFNMEEISLRPNEKRVPYDRLITKNIAQEIDSESKVSIIIPAYNGEELLRTSIESMLNQTWKNIEILVVDDCSNDGTINIIKEYESRDQRIKLIRTGINGGAYVARNHALKVASGEFVTINDADDWSHPRKIEVQVKHLISNPKVIANFSQQARATENLRFYRRGKPGIYVFANMSSFMFRREDVMKKLGYWDCVRFAGDSEFVKRVKKVFGEKSISELPTAPLSFQRQSESSLTSHSAFGFPGYFFGVRKEYAEAHDFYHDNNKENLHYDFPQRKRPFPVPEPMWPKRDLKPDGIRHFDVIIASEFRLLGGTNMSNIEEIKAQKQMGLNTGLIQMSRYDLNSVEVMNPKVRELIDGDKVQMIVYGEKVSCDLLILRHPPALQVWQEYIPDVDAKNISVIVNQPPKRDYSGDGDTLYDIRLCVQHLEKYFGQTGIWYPIGPLVRETLEDHHKEELDSINLADEDWVNIIDVNEWKRISRPSQGDKIKIGRHSRDQYVKWPDDRKKLLSIYPDSKEYEVYILGGAKAPKKVLGQLPENWCVNEFGEMHPKDFLSDLDVFVYFTHPDWVEAFGRVIFEAMAVGVPVIIPPVYKELFGEAAIYAEPHEVKKEIAKLMDNPEYYQSQVETALVFVEKQFGYSKHASRLEGFLHG